MGGEDQVRRCRQQALDQSVVLRATLRKRARVCGPQTSTAGHARNIGRLHGRHSYGGHSYESASFTSICAAARPGKIPASAEVVATSSPTSTATCHGKS